MHEILSENILNLDLEKFALSFTNLGVSTRIVMLRNENNLVITIGNIQRNHEECAALSSLFDITSTPQDDKIISSIIGVPYDTNVPGTQKNVARIEKLCIGYNSSIIYLYER